MTGDGIAGRIAELERLLYARPDAALAQGQTANDRVEAVDELRRLRALTTRSDEGAPRDRLDAAGRAEPPTTPAPPAPDARPRPERASRPDPHTVPVAARRRVVLVGVACLTLILGVLLALSWDTTPRPPAMAAFDTPLSPLDQVRSETLRTIGLPLLDEGRVLNEFDESPAQIVVFRTAAGTAELLRAGAESAPVESGFVPSVSSLYELPRAPASPSDALRAADVCAWVIDRSFPAIGECASLAEFTTDGISFETLLFSGGGFRVDWQPSGAVSLTPITDVAPEP